MLHSLNDSCQARPAQFCITEGLYEKARSTGVNIVAVPDVDTFSYFPKYCQANIGNGLRLPFPEFTQQRQLSYYRTVVLEMVRPENNSLVGFIALSYQSCEDTEQRETGAIGIEYLAVQQKFQNSDYARLLVECAAGVAAAMRSPCLIPVACVNADAMDFYESVGFKRNKTGMLEYDVKPLSAKLEPLKLSQDISLPPGLRLKKVPLLFGVPDRPSSLTTSESKDGHVDSCEGYRTLLKRVHDPSLSEDEQKSAYLELKHYVESLPVTSAGKNLPAWTNCAEEKERLGYQTLEDNDKDIYCNPDYTEAYAPLKADYQALSHATEAYDFDDDPDAEVLQLAMRCLRESQLNIFIDQLAANKQPVRLVIDYRFHPSVAGDLAHKLLCELKERKIPIAELIVRPTWFDDDWSGGGNGGNTVAAALMTLINDFSGYKLALGGIGYGKAWAAEFFHELYKVMLKEQAKEKCVRVPCLDLSMLTLIHQAEFCPYGEPARNAEKVADFFLNQSNYVDVIMH